MMDPGIKKQIDDLVGGNKVVLFMKGTPDFPQCGFSMRAISILRSLNTDFATFDILSDDTMRAAVKEYGNWPTYPQLYIHGQLVGGSDIMMEMWEQGELEKLIEPSAS